MVTVAARREAVEFIKTRHISERRGCRLISLNRKSCRYQKRRRVDSDLIKRLRQLAVEHPRFGYRRIHALLKRGDFNVNLKCVYRLWRQENLSLPRRRPGKPRAKAAVGIVPKATRVNQIWTYDFVFDQSLSGKSLKMLTLIDEFTRECLAVEVGVSIKSARVQQILQRVCSEKGVPELIRSDNGSEFIGKAVGNWLEKTGIKPLFIEPGKPWQNGKGESFNGKLRDECLSREWFSSVKEAQVMIEGWRKFYNEERPHSSLEYLTPLEFKSQMKNNKSLAIQLG
ncbi:MAG: IS3 family transposase [Acidobacteriota bacterium]|nr:IS3 family transposase [Acidobacteriota bacterium]